MTPRRKLFAHFRALGNSVSQSFVAAEFKGDRKAASKNGAKLEANLEIRALVADLKATKSPENIRSEILRIKGDLNDKKAERRNMALHKIAAERGATFARNNTPNQRPVPVNGHDVRAMEYCVSLVIRESAKIVEEISELGGDPLVLSVALNTHRAASTAQVEWLDRLREADAFAVSQHQTRALDSNVLIDVGAAIVRLEKCHG